MHSAILVFAFGAIACASAGGFGLGHHGAVGITHDVISRPAYTYSYSVADKGTGDHKSATETRDGDITKGSYSLLQPDGIWRTVNYISTPASGFQAQVINKGVGAHPARLAAAAPVAIAAPYGIGYGHDVVGAGLGNGVGYGHGLIGAGLGNVFGYNAGLFGAGLGNVVGYNAGLGGLGWGWGR